MTWQIADLRSFGTALRRAFRHTIIVALGSALANIAAPGAAQACVVPNNDRSFEFFRTAEVILVGNITSYARVPAEHHAVFEFETVRVIIGSRMGKTARWRAEWTNSTFGEPENWDGARMVIVGLRAKINNRGEPVIEVVQKSCSFSPSLVPASEENLHVILRDSGIYIDPQAPVLKDIPWP